MLNIIQNNINNTPKTLHNLVWSKITNGIKLNEKELNYLKKYKIKSIVEYGLIANGCWIINSYEEKIWYKYGKKHREDGAAVEYYTGRKEYWLNGKRHREDGPAVIWPEGAKVWYKEGKRHRDDGPAVEFENETKEYYKNGKLHREDGPAIEWASGLKSYYLNNQYYTERNYWQEINATNNSK